MIANELLSSKQGTTGVGEDVQTLEPCALRVGMQNGQLPWKLSGGSSTGHTSNDHMVQQPHFWVFTQIIESGVWKRYLYPQDRANTARFYL